MRFLPTHLPTNPRRNKMMNDIQKLVNEQAEDEGLWFEAKTAPEAYLQQELRRLHYAIENNTKENTTNESIRE